MSIGFLHPGLALAALGLLAVPPLIHLLARRRQRDVPWAAMAFLIAAHQQTRRRLRIEQWLLMALRILVIGCAGFAVARPALRAGGVLDAGSRRIDRVILLDDSLSMRARRPDGRTAFDAARALAGELIDGFGRTDAVLLARLGGGGVTVTDRPTTDRALLHQIVDELKCGYGEAGVAAAARAAAEAVRSSGSLPDRVAVYYLTDLARGTWLPKQDQEEAGATDVADLAAAFGNLGEPDARFLIDVGAAARPNRAITDVRLAGGWAAPGFTSVLRVVVQTYDAATDPTAALEVELDGEPVHREPIGDLPETGSRTVTLPVRFESGGAHALVVRLRSSGDALPDDDERWLSVTAFSGVPALLAAGDSAALTPESDAFYFALALAPPRASASADRAGGPFATTLVHENELTTVSLTDYRAVVLLNPADPGPEAVERLAGYVRGGGGLVIGMGGRTTSADRAKNDPAGAAWLTRLTGLRVGVFAASDPPLELRSAGGAHPLLDEFIGRPAVGIFKPTFRGHVRVEPPRGRDTTDHALLTFSDGDPALLEVPIQRGRVLVWTSSFDMEWNALAAQPDFVPFVINLTAHAAGADDAGRNVAVGAPLHASVPPARDGRLPQIIRPDGSHEAVQLFRERDDAERSQLQPIMYGRSDLPGRYSLDGTPPAALFAANVPPIESDLTVAGESALRAALGRDFSLVDAPRPEALSAAAPQRSEMSGFLFDALFVLLLVETLIAALFGRHA